ncbi:MAG TPA: substrate-binding domain-containing protein [Polyangiaceae bacterium]|jgi:DNA-binding LacI/PurR family transcriptional regulator
MTTAQRALTAPKKTIAFMMDWLDGAYQCQILEGAREAARDRGVHLVCFAGGMLGTDARGGAHRNATFDLITPDNVDGVIVMAGSVGNRLATDDLLAYCERFKGLPCVSVSRELPGCSCVTVDNRAGLESAISHLIRVHGIKSIAFLRGTEQNPEAELRYRVYRDVLAAHGLPFEEKLLCSGDFLFPSGVAAVATLYDERKLEPEAIVAANDEMAMGVLSELAKRGIRVPDQVAVIGFDDIDNARYTSPPLTTVKQPLHELGREAVRLVMAEIYGSQPGERITLHTEFIARRSCRCFSRDLRPALNLPASRGSFEAALVERRQLLLADLARSARGSLGMLGSGWELKLMNAFATELRGGSASGFRSLFEETLDKLLEHDADFNLCHDVLSTLRRHMLACLGADASARAQAEELFHEARTLIGQVSERAQARQRLHVTRWASALAETAAELTACANFTQLSGAVARHFPGLGLDSCFVAAYPPEPGPIEFAVHYTKSGEAPRLENLPTLTRGFVRQLSEARASEAFFVSTVFSETRVIGCVLFTLDPKRGIVCEALREFLGAALRGMPDAN